MIGYKNLSLPYTSRVSLVPNKIKISASGSAIQSLSAEYVFKQREDGSDLHFNLDVNFSSIVYAALAEVSLDSVVRQVVEAFVARADSVPSDERIVIQSRSILLGGKGIKV